MIGVLRRNSAIRHFLHLPSVCYSWFPSISVSRPSSRSSTDRSKDTFQPNLGTNPLPRLVVDVHVSSVSRPPTELCLTPKPCRQRYLSSHITALVIHHQCPSPLRLARDLMSSGSASTRTLETVPQPDTWLSTCASFIEASSL